MNVASKELCEELFKLSGWNDTFWNYSRSSYSDFPFKLGHKGSIETREVKERYPAYDLGYLLRKLAEETRVTIEFVHSGCSMSLDMTDWCDKWIAFLPNERQGDYIFANTPEDAAAKLAIRLFKKGILVKDKV